ncbi:hypothetical protein FJZ31_13840 [Candidatus Poribacteria bacterium]|nr:hypothetical protein [Candidatus Poribacteria bacterium]
MNGIRISDFGFRNYPTLESGGFLVNDLSQKAATIFGTKISGVGLKPDSSKGWAIPLHAWFRQAQPGGMRELPCPFSVKINVVLGKWPREEINGKEAKW